MKFRPSAMRSVSRRVLRSSDKIRGNVNVNVNGLTGLPSIACKELNKKPPQDFSFNVAKHILHQGLTKTPQENLLCSPLCTSVVLNMLVPGAKGETLDQLLEFLEFNSEEQVDKSALKLMDTLRPSEVEDGPKISFTNTVWIDQQYPLTRSYEEFLRNVHRADVKIVDFQFKADEVREEVNLWAKKKTEGMIKSILPEVSYYNDTIMILANAFSFKLETPDTSLDSSKTPLSLYHCGSFEGSEVLRMPYKDASIAMSQDDRSFSMYIFVPTKKNCLPKFIQEMKMDAKTFEKQVKRSNEEISNIYVPRFNLESELPLSDTMKQLGLTLPFMAGQNELTRFVDSPLADLLYVTDVTQKSRMETNKGGTTLSVVTYIALCGPEYHPVALPSKLKFVADNPFLFMIREDFSGAMVSAGTMLSTPLSS